MMFEGTPDRDWQPAEKRTNKLVFIGRCACARLRLRLRVHVRCARCMHGARRVALNSNFYAHS